MKSAVLATLLAFGSLCSLSAACQGTPAASADKLAGMWMVEVTRTSPPSPAPFLSMQTYSAEGAVLEESNNPTVPRSLAQGTWQKVGPGQFKRLWVYFRYNSFSEPRTFIGTSNNTAIITITPDGRAFIAEAVVELRDAAGAFEAVRTFSEVGQRF